MVLSKVLPVAMLIFLFFSGAEAGTKYAHEIDHKEPWKAHGITEGEYRTIHDYTEDIKYFWMGAVNTGSNDTTRFLAALLYYTSRDGLTRYSPGGTIVLEVITEMEQKCPECKWNNLFIGVYRGEHKHKTPGRKKFFGAYAGSIFLGSKDTAVHVLLPDGKEYCGIQIEFPWAEPVMEHGKSEITISKSILTDCMPDSAMIIFRNKGSIISLTLLDLYAEGNIETRDIPIEILESHEAKLVSAGYPRCFKVVIDKLKQK